MLWCICGYVVWTGVRRLHYVMATERAANVELNIAIADVEKDIVWVEEHEVKYRGKMFDIKTVSLAGGTLKLTGHFDEADDHLFSLLEKLFNEKRHDRKASNVLLWLCEATIPASYDTQLYACYGSPEIKQAHNEGYAPLFEPATPYQPPIPVII